MSRTYIKYNVLFVCVRVCTRGRAWCTHTCLFF